MICVVLGVLFVGISYTVLFWDILVHFADKRGKTDLRPHKQAKRRSRDDEA